MSRNFLENIYYFITVPTAAHQGFFYDQTRKDLLLNRIINTSKKLEITNIDFGILSNHYHFIGYFTEWNQVPKFLQLINGGVSFELNRFENKQGRKIWDEYHIYYINNAELLNRIRGYVVGNPYKHREVNSIEELYNYKFSSFRKLIKKEGKDTAKNLVLSVIKMSSGDFYKELEKYRDVTLASVRDGSAFGGKAS